jgi:hypothetical protein
VLNFVEFHLPLQYPGTNNVTVSHSFSVVSVKYSTTDLEQEEEEEEEEEQEEEQEDVEEGGSEEFTSGSDIRLPKPEISSQSETAAAVTFAEDGTKAAAADIEVFGLDSAQEKEEEEEAEDEIKDERPLLPTAAVSGNSDVNEGQTTSLSDYQEEKELEEEEEGGEGGEEGLGSVEQEEESQTRGEERKVSDGGSERGMRISLLQPEQIEKKQEEDQFEEKEEAAAAKDLAENEDPQGNDDYDLRRDKNVEEENGSDVGRARGFPDQRFPKAVRVNPLPSSSSSLLHRVILRLAKNQTYDVVRGSSNVVVDNRRPADANAAAFEFISAAFGYETQRN